MSGRRSVQPGNRGIRAPELSAIATAFLALFALASAGCDGTAGMPVPPRAFLAPSPESVEGARALRREIPSARVIFSQLTGQTLLVDGGGQPLARATFTGRESDGLAAVGAVAALMSRHPTLFGIENPEESLRLALDGTREAPAARGSLRAFRFEQIRGRLPVRGRHGVAFFSSDGALLALSARLTPTRAIQVPAETSAGDRPAGSIGGWDLSEGTLTMPGKPGLRIPRIRRMLDDRDGSGVFRLYEERMERRGRALHRRLRDSQGRVLESYLDLPSAAAPLGWESAGAPVARPARDPLGAIMDVPSTLLPDGKLVLGFRIDGIHDAASGISIADAAAGDDPAFVPAEPFATDATDWLGDAAYDGGLRDATRLARNLERVTRWFHDELGWDSWDGRGGAFHAAVNGRWNPDPAAPPRFDAMGGDGILLVGAGHSPAGRPISDSLEIVGHEFAHSVVDATADFATIGEAGALNEALADLFGVAAAGFGDSVLGEDSGCVLRDVLRPWTLDQPARYSELRELPLERDGGGAHLNSGIIARALALVMVGDNPGLKGADDLPGLPRCSRSNAATAMAPGALAGSFAGTSNSMFSAASSDSPLLRAGLGPVPVARFLLEALRDVPYSRDSKMEEFSAATLLYCRARERAGTPSGAGSSWVEGLCESLARAFESVELLRFGEMGR